MNCGGACAHKLKLLELLVVFRGGDGSDVFSGDGDAILILCGGEGDGEHIRDSFINDVDRLLHFINSNLLLT